MANPLNNVIGNPMNNMPMNQLMKQFNEFKKNFHGDPQQKVQELLNSGQMTQQQFNQLSQMARQFQQMMGK